MSPVLNGSSAILCFEGSDTIKICDGITFDFYTGLPSYVLVQTLQPELKSHSSCKPGQCQQTPVQDFLW